jgi:cell division protease FtsH
VVTRHYLESQLAVAWGGRVAEEIVFGQDKVSSGAMGDIQQATNLAKSMVTQMGFSRKLGNVSYSDNNHYFPGGLIAEDTKKIIDDEVKRYVQEGYETAYRILKRYRKDLDTLANALIEYETLTGDEIKDLVFNNKRPVRD